MSNWKQLLPGHNFPTNLESREGQYPSAQLTTLTITFNELFLSPDTIYEQIWLLCSSVNLLRPTTILQRNYRKPGTIHQAIWQSRVLFFRTFGRYMKGLYFLSKLVYKSVRVWTSGRSLPVKNFVEFAPLPPGERILLTWAGTPKLTVNCYLSPICRRKNTYKLACVAGGIVRVRRKILTVESEYGRWSREENGKEPREALAARPPLPRVGLARATIFRQLRRLLISPLKLSSYFFVSDALWQSKLRTRISGRSPPNAR